MKFKLPHIKFLSLWFGALALSLLGGCDWMPGKPSSKNIWKPPEANLDFHSLYSTNCIACHAGPKGIAPSISLGNSTYLALITPEKMREVISKGVPGTAMPPFLEQFGGRLTEAQIDVLVKGIFAWKDSKKVPPGPLPHYSASPGDASRGAQVYSVNCASCHGVEGTGGKAGSVVDSSYLNLVSDQYLRTIVIAGRPEVGHPNWHDTATGKPLSDQDVADVVAWLISHRGQRKGDLPAEMRR
ncbi:MAG: hypothetical protein C5B47_07585 [Verrucomicrobia bacterium]|nr:MAG: hypothetical protein C5B47_07585 [Verrucomicrobiota bacterium]